MSLESYYSIMTCSAESLDEVTDLLIEWMRDRDTETRGGGKAELALAEWVDTHLVWKNGAKEKR